MHETEISSDHFRKNLEYQEAAYCEAYCKLASADFREDFGLGFQDREGTLVTYATKIDILAFNRVIGWGLTQPARGEQVDEMIAIYRNAGVRRFFVQVSPQAKPEGLNQFLEDKGLYYYNNWVKFYRSLQGFPASKSSLSIEQITGDKSEIFSKIIVTAFDWPEFLMPLISAPVGAPGWRHYLAYKGEVPIASAALFIRGTFATLALAATLPQYQGHGAQSALISRRFRDAAKAGCHWMFTETAEETPERSIPSYRNMMRYGFTIAYRRPNYIYEFSKL